MADNDPDFLRLFARETDVVSLKQGETLFKRGDKAQFAYVVLTGQLRVGDGNAVYDTIMVGGMLGEMALIDHGLRSATATATADCTLAKIDEKRFLFLVQQTPMFALNVMRLMSHRLRRMNDIIKGT